MCDEMRKAGRGGLPAERKILMGQKDLAQKHLESYPDVFADVVNALLYGGRKIVREEELLPAPTESLYSNDGKKLKNQFQDMSMYIVCSGHIHMQYTFENQTKPERRHVLRKAGYEGAIYRIQYESKDLYPVVGAVLYWGRKRWKSPVGLKGLFKNNSFMKDADQYVDDVNLHVYEMAHLPSKVRARFTSDMRVVVDYLAEGKDYHPTDQKILHVEAFLHLLRALTGDARYEEIIPELLKEKEEVGMCELLDKYENRGMEQGLKQGLKQGQEGTLIENLQSLTETMNLTIDKAMEVLRVPEEKRAYYAQKVQG